MQTTLKIVQRLPSLPAELDIIYLRPSSHGVDDRDVQKEFDKKFHVNRYDIETWLHYLIANHPDYQGFQKDQSRLAQLPANDSILPQIPTMIDQNPGRDDRDSGEEAQDGDKQNSLHNENNTADAPSFPLHDDSHYEDPVFTQDVCVLDLAGDRSETHLPQARLHKNSSDISRAPFSMATIGSQPVNEYDCLLHTARMAFLTLFPNDAASFAVSRRREVSQLAYFQHLVRYKVGRFARYPQFRYLLGFQYHHEDKS